LVLRAEAGTHPRQEIPTIIPGGMQPMNTKPKHPNTDASQHVREITETGAEQSKEVFEKFGSAASEAADVMTNCCSAAFKGMQDYSRKLIEFSHANAQSHVEFLQKLASVKSPTEWLELSADHTRGQLERIGDQARHLTELTKQVTLATTEPVKTGLAKAYDRAA
jgi:phasin